MVYVINNINGEEIVGAFYKKRIAKKKKKKSKRAKNWKSNQEKRQ